MKNPYLNNIDYIIINRNRAIICYYLAINSFLIRFHYEHYPFYLYIDI